MHTRSTITAAVSLSLGTIPLAIPVAIAGPIGGVVVAGQGTIKTSVPGTTVIDQASKQLQLNWNSFNVGANETVQFRQPSSTAIAFNRILDQSPSQIFGQVQGNGQVVLVNPNGFLIGRTAQLNVNSLVVSSLDAIDFDAASGRYKFSSANNPGAVINQGTITAGRGGSVTLLGGQVSNSGSIVADFGTVNLAAGRAATLDLAGDGLLRLEVGSDLLTNGSAAVSAVENSGTISADGGQVVLTANAVRDVFTNLVNNTGVIRANRIENAGGAIQLVGPGGQVLSSGTLDASSGDSVSTGGSVSVLGERVGLMGNAVVDVSGATGGGTALIGGDYHGSNPNVLNAQLTYVDGGASINADAGSYGNGGRIVVWSDDVTVFNGRLSARGGGVSGAGGFAEVSGKQFLSFTGSADLTGAHGAWGTLLLDPDTLVIDPSSPAPMSMGTGGALLYTDLGDPPDTTLATIGASTITTLLGSTDVKLQANSSITQQLGANIDSSGDANALHRSLELDSGGTIDLNAGIALNHGDVTLSAAGDVTLAGSISSGGGIVSITTTNASSPTKPSILMTGSGIDAGSGNVVLIADQDIKVTTLASTSAVDLTATQGSILNAAGPAHITANQLTLSAGDSIGSPGNALGTQVSGTGATIDATAGQFSGSSGGIDISQSGGDFRLAASSAGVANDVTVNSTGGTMTVGNLTAAGSGTTVTLTGDTIADDLDDSTQITTHSVFLTTNVGGGAIGGAAAHADMDLSVDGLSAQAAGAGVFAHDNRGLVLTKATAGSGSILVSAAGNLGVGTVSAPTSVELDAAGAITMDAGSTGPITSDSLTLTAAAGIGTGSTSIGTKVNSLTAVNDAQGTGGIFVANQGNLNITNAAALGTGGSINVAATTLGGGNPGNLVVQSIATSGDVYLTADGSIASSGPGSNIQGVGLHLTAKGLSGAGSIGGTTPGSQINSNVQSLAASATSGGINLVNTGDIFLSSVAASGGGSDVQVTSTNGGITLETVSAGHAVTLSAANGAIADDGTDPTSIVAGSGGISLAAATGIGTVANFDAGTGSAIDVNTPGPLSATVSSGSGQINLGIVGTLQVTPGSIKLGNGSASSGAIVLQAAGSLDAAGLAPGAIVIGATNSTDVALRSGGVLTLPSGGAYIDAVPGGLLVHGTDIVDNDGTPRELAFSAGTLNFQSGAPSGATVLDTTIGRLEATIGAAQNLTVNETGDMTVGTVSAAGGSVSLLATGQISDDGNAGTRIIANGLTLQGTGLGDAAHSLGTQVATLTANTTAGGIYVNEADDLTLSAHAVGGPVNVQTGGALTVAALPGGGVTGSGVTLSTGSGAGSNLTVLGAIDGGSGSVNLTANGNGSAIILDDAVSTSGNAVLTAGSSAGRGNISTAGTGAIHANALTLTGLGIGSSATPLTTDVGSVTATGGVGGIFISEADALTVDATASGGPVSIQTGTGTLTVNSASGTGVSLTAGGDGNALVIDGAVNGGSGNVALAATGAGGQINLNSTVTTTGDAALTAGTAASRGAINSNGGRVNAVNLTASGASVGAAGLQLNTKVASLDATATNGDINVQEDDGLNLTASAVNGSLRVATLNGPMTVVTATSGANGIALSTGGSGNDLTVNGPINAGVGALNLTASGAIAAGAGNLITANNAVLAGSAIGAVGARLNTVLGSLDAQTSNGGIFVSEADALSLNAVTTNGPLDVRTANGALTVASAVGDGVTLQTAGDGNGIVLNGGSSGGIQGRTGGVTLMTSGAGSNITLNDSIVSTGPVSVLASGDGSVVTLNSTVGTTGNVVITAGSAANRGAIVAGASGGISGAAATLTGAQIGSSSAAINTANSSISATSTSGGLFIKELDAVSLSANAVGGPVNVQAGGALTVTSATGDGVTLVASGAGAGIAVAGDIEGGSSPVTLTASDAVTAGTGNHVGGTALTVAGSSIGASGTPLNTSVGSLNATGTHGGVFVTNAGALNLIANASGGALNVATASGSLVVNAATGAGVVLAAGGSGSGITLNTLVDGGAGDVTLTAGSASNPGAIVNGSGGGVKGAALTAVGTSIGSSSAPLSTNIASLTANATQGDVYINEQDDLTLADVRASGSVGVSSSSGNIVVRSLSASNSVSLTAGSGAIQDDGDDTTKLSAGTVTLLAQSIGAPSTLTAQGLDSKSRLDVTATTLDATATSGGIYIDALTGLSSASVRANGGANGNIELLAAAGNLNLLKVTATHTVLLAAGGNIFALPGLGSISAQSAELRAGGADPTAGHIGTVSQPLSLTLNPGNTLRLYVPQTVDSKDSTRAPSTLPSTGVVTTLSLFGAPNGLADQAGFGQFQGLGDSQFTSPAEALVRSIQNQTAAIQTVLGLDWGSFDPNVSLFGTLDPSVCLPSDQRDEEKGGAGC